MKKSSSATLLTAALALGLPAAAQSTPWYAGAALGQARAGSVLVSDREATIGNGNEPGIASTSDLKDSAGKLFAGFQISEVFAVEAHYTDLGRQRIDTSFEVPFSATGHANVHTERKVSGYGIDVLAGTEIAAGLRAFAKAGVFRSRTQNDTTLSGDTHFADGTEGVFRSRSFDETNLKYGAGLQYDFNRSLSARLEWERVPDLGERLVPGNTAAVGEADHDSWWLGVVFRFP